uniref:pre-mRNA-splicing factor SPF27 n=1 Tax=Pristiophorus japonicus TaxID=55135 RepID=UPI00398E3FDD
MAGPLAVAGDVVVDALPYFDQGYDAPGVREAAAALVEEETRRYRPTKNYLSYLPTPDYSAFELPSLSFFSWVALVSKNYEIERAIVQLESEINKMKQQQGDENKENIRQDF